MNAHRWLFAAVGIVAIFLAFTIPGQLSGADFSGSVVKVERMGGHGSGVHIGNGLILTAGHVTRGTNTVKIKTDDNEVFDGEVLWHSPDPGQGGYDVSLVHVRGMQHIAAAKLSCLPSYVGQHIRIVGNPHLTEFVTSWGRVAKVGSSGIEKHWRVLVTLDATATNGVSGGAVFDESSGQLIGLLVAGYPGTGYSFMVPASVLCMTLARA